MSYQALYRVWRPQTFDELIGQSVITETLKNAIKHGQTSHAYLFTGPRGTGKTSAAKIFAKAINCPHQKDGNPCNDCEICRGITQGILSDVVEIDAASNNGVEEIRNLRDNVRYAASEAQYKVYIIDEVHMLTTGAFNALLKTLEEPPENVIFILATTEPHKIPATIISRTQRFDFQRITQKHLVERMKEILDHDGVHYEDEALQIIARAANGGMRDSLSLLDQALSYDHQAVNAASALEVSGSLSQLAFVDYLLAIYQHQGEEALEILQAQLQQGKQAHRFVEELILFSRDILLSLHSKVNQTLLSSEEIKPLQEQIPAAFYYDLIDRLNDVQNKMRFSTQNDLYIEVMTIQLAQENQALSQPSNDQPIKEESKAPQITAEIQELQQQVQKLQQQLAEGIVQKPMPSILDNLDEVEDRSTSISEQARIKTPRPRPQYAQQGFKEDKQQIFHVLNSATKEDFSNISNHWEEILSQLSPQERAIFIESQPYAAGPSMVIIGFFDTMFAGMYQGNIAIQRRIYRLSEDIIGQGYQVVCLLNQDWLKLRSDYLNLRKTNMNRPLDISQETLDYFSHMTEVLQEKEPNIQSNKGDVEDDLAMGNPVISRPNFEEPEPEEKIQGQSEEKEEVPPIVSEALKLFGEDIVNVYYDR